MLKQRGYEVVEAADGVQELRQAVASQVDLAITDLVMPEKEGLETIHALRRDKPGSESSPSPAPSEVSS